MTGKASPNKRRQKKMSDCAYSALLPFVTLLKGRKEGKKEGRKVLRTFDVLDVQRRQIDISVGWSP